ncbi:DUF815 domain-containing protein [Helicobacter fennelliae]|uniref:DUF815 domain-containing protein n=1 Tax=Helicobacter fennelliae TaxID=215 RepID=UPI000E0517F1|nr:DUF815 domain-containing protein [Helicobacter fennelliae]STQ85164.1 putative ATP/GTP-binding protein [Helicobacter fennelliae]
MTEALNECLHIDCATHYAWVFRRFEQHYYMHPISDFDTTCQRLVGVDEQMYVLESNTQAFLSGKPALNALLWGARGCGKSSVVKAVILKHLFTSPLRVIELDTKDILILPLLLDMVRQKREYKFIIFCDDLSFYAEEKSYKSIKSVLEGSFEKWADNVLIYATSNIRRILEDQSTDLSPQHSIAHETLSFSDRFGLQIGFYDLGTDEYLAIVASFLSDISSHLSLDALLEPENPIRLQALAFATQVGNRSARTARDFVARFYFT